MLIAALTLAVLTAVPPPADTLAGRVAPPRAARDTARRVVRQFTPVEVVGGRVRDTGSIETVQAVSRGTLATLPVDGLAGAIGLQSGVVARGEDLHVRGGRAGELRTSILGVSLAEPRRRTPMDVPLFAVRSLDVLAGGLDADHAGALAGEVDLQTERPTASPAMRVRWSTDGHTRTTRGFEALHALWTGPLRHTGLGLAAAVEARLDDQSLPDARSSTGGVFGRGIAMRNDDRLLGWVKLAPLAEASRTSIEWLGARTIERPYDPMFTYDGWVTLSPPDVNGHPNPFPILTGRAPRDASWFRYRAADHVPITERRRFALVASHVQPGPLALRGTLGLLRSSERTAVGLSPSRGYVNDLNKPVFGPSNTPGLSPFVSYAGDVPYWSEGEGSSAEAKLEGLARPAPGQRVRFGAGASYEDVRFTELDDARPEATGVDTLRTYHGFAPSLFAFVQHRWEFSGLIWNGGLRAESFTAGSKLPSARTIWSLSPRVGFAYPVSTRDAFSLAYSRIFQLPARDLLYESRRIGYDRHPLGNPSLTPAEVISWQAALKHILDQRWFLQIAAFSRDVFGEPGVRQMPTRPGQFGWHYESAEDAHADGAELALHWQHPDGQRLQIAYTFMNAWGTQSSEQGLAYGLALGTRPVPVAPHPLDWDIRHSLAFAGDLHAANDWVVSWVTQVTSGAPWTPLGSDSLSGTGPLTQYADQSLVNSRRLPWSENTDVLVRYQAKWLRGARLLLSVTNAFANATPRRVSVSGYPNPSINTLYDEYAIYRTATGRDGGAYWNNSNGDGIGEWNEVHDPRLAAPPRTLRIGIEWMH